MRRFENLKIWKWVVCHSEVRGISIDASFLSMTSRRAINNFHCPILVRQPSPFVKGAGGLLIPNKQYSPNSLRLRDMKTYIFLILSLFQFSIGYSQKGSNLKLVYCEEVVSSDVTNYGKDIIGYYQLMNTEKENTRIARINNLLRLWHRYSFKMERNSEIWYKQYDKRHYLASGNCMMWTPEDSLAWVRSIESFGNRQFIIRDTLSISNKYNLPYNSNAALNSYLNAPHVFTILNDSIVFIGINYSGYQSAFYNLNTGLETGIYDCLINSKRNVFFGYIFNKATNHNKDVIKNIATNSRSSEHGYVIDGITLLPEIGFDNETNEMFMQFSFGSIPLRIPFKEIEKYFNPNCFLFKIQDSIK